MSKGLKTGIWVVVAILIIIVVYSLSGKDGVTPAEGESIKIGVISPLTGDAAVYGEPALNIYRLAVDEINQTGGIDGKQIELIVEDDKCTGKDGANATQKLVGVDKVEIIIGSLCSSATLSAAPIAEAAKVALFSPGATSPDLTGVRPYFFRNFPSDATQGKVLAEVSYQDKKWKKIAFIQEQQDYALGIFKAFSATFEKLGGAVTKEEFPVSVTDFRSILTKIKAAKPDAIFVDTQTPAASDRILKQMVELKVNLPVIVNDATAGDSATILANKNVLENGFTAEFGIDPTNEKFKHFLEAYKSKYNGDAPYLSYAQTEYDSIYMIKDAISAVGYDGEKIAAWSRTVKDWSGASGLITIGPDGDRLGGHVAKIIKDGKVEIYVK